jgi:drug/metabolite transporter (DMT)-like permease
VWAGLLGFIVWGDVPTPVVLVGSAIIVSAGIYIVRREAILRRQGARAAATAPGSPQDS